MAAGIYTQSEGAQIPCCHYQIYTLYLQTGDSHRISPWIGKTTCAFFRPGTDEVLFASTHLDAEAEIKGEAELEFRAAGKERRYSWDYDENMDIFSAWPLPLKRGINHSCYLQAKPALEL